MLNLLPEAHQCKNEGLVFLPTALGHWMEALFLERPAPTESSPAGKGMGLTFTSPVLDGCWMGWPSCFSVLGFRPQVLTEGVLSETTRSQTSNLSAFSLPTSHRHSQLPTLGPLPLDSPFSRVCPSSYRSGERPAWPWAVPCCCLVPH